MAAPALHAEQDNTVSSVHTRSVMDGSIIWHGGDAACCTHCIEVSAILQSVWQKHLLRLN